MVLFSVWLSPEINRLLVFPWFSLFPVPASLVCGNNAEGWMLEVLKGLQQKAMCSCRAGQLYHYTVVSALLPVYTKDNSWLFHDGACLLSPLVYWYNPRGWLTYLVYLKSKMKTSKNERRVKAAVTLCPILCLFSHRLSYLLVWTPRLYNSYEVPWWYSMRHLRLWLCPLALLHNNPLQKLES